MVEPPGKPRVSHERLALESLRAAIDDHPDAEVFSGQGGSMVRQRTGRKAAPEHFETLQDLLKRLHESA